MPPSLRRSPLYSAVVLAGVSLTTTALTVACGDDDNGPTGGADASTSSSGGSSGGSSSGSSGANDSGSDASSTNDTGAPGDACPPDSEISTPPCVLIK